eukprot:CAMPEP_0185840164 /NCGR_PEP_ID=MMETSP1353-20130828/15780_1 /TAXON_ID=1077150 /ORGANISM="Erythrolobus australicus, Strain CCMP3124" /LENGTH=190 /DNA_ID=CAMNT_0028539453 /DNA_START=230 /DNA_END=802 /DNA_ORIENTATION=-
MTWDLNAVRGCSVSEGARADEGVVPWDRRDGLHGEHYSFAGDAEMKERRGGRGAARSGPELGASTRSPPCKNLLHLEDVDEEHLIRTAVWVHRKLLDTQLELSELRAQLGEAGVLRSAELKRCNFLELQNSKLRAALRGSVAVQADKLARLQTEKDLRVQAEVCALRYFALLRTNLIDALSCICVLHQTL